MSLSKYSLQAVLVELNGTVVTRYNSNENELHAKMLERGFEPYRYYTNSPKSDFPRMQASQHRKYAIP